MQTSSISLNANELGIKNIEITSKGWLIFWYDQVWYFSEIINVNSFEMHRTEEVLEIKVDRLLVPGSEIILKIDYIGFINDKMVGFYRSSYEDLLNGELK